MNRCTWIDCNGISCGEVFSKLVDGSGKADSWRDLLEMLLGS